jgi:hypothetical protein
MSLELVPFSAAWINHDKMDLHAIYRRPRFVQDEYGEWQREFKDGAATWDLTGPLPVRSHNRWIAKGFEYVTLANRGSLAVAHHYGTLPEGRTVESYEPVKGNGPWNYRRYAEGMAQAATRDAEQLREDVLRFGSDVVQHLRRRENPQFELPPELRGIMPAGAAAAPAEGAPRKGRNAEVPA